MRKRGRTAEALKHGGKRRWGLLLCASVPLWLVFVPGCGSKRSIEALEGKGDAAMLAYRFAPAASRTYRTLVTQKFEVRNTEGGPKRLEVRVDLDLNTTQTVIEPATGPGGAKLKIAFPRASVSVRGPRADSASHLENVIRQTEFVARVDSQGKVLELGLADTAPSNLKGLFGGVGQALVALGPVLPGEAKAPGATWQDKQPLTVALPGGDVMKGSLMSQYRFMRWVRVNGRAAAEIKVDMTLSMTPGEMRVPMQGSGAGAGYLYVSPEEGVLVASDVTFVSTGVYNMGGGQYNFAGGAILEQNVEHRVTMDLVQ